MKTLALSVIFVLSSIFAFSQCPDSGSTTNKKIAHLNELKNRDVFVMQNPKHVSIDSILKTGEDSNRFSNSYFVVTEGWVVAWKLGGAESCNCKTEDKDDWDIHLVIGKDSTDSESQCMVVEVTGKSKLKMGVDNTYGKEILHHRVRIFGWMMYDFEHKQNSVNTAKAGCKDIFRMTAWEIHPVTKIDVLQ